MSQYVDLTLDRPRRFKLTPDDYRSAARTASQLFGMPIATQDLTRLIGKEDDTAMACVLAVGCRHEDAKFTVQKALDFLDDRRTKGEDREDVGEAILEALRGIGVLRRDAEEADVPNAPTPSTSSTSNDG